MYLNFLDKTFIKIKAKCPLIAILIHPHSHSNAIIYRKHRGKWMHKLHMLIDNKCNHSISGINESSQHDNQGIIMPQPCNMSRIIMLVKTQGSSTGVAYLVVLSSTGIVYPAILTSLDTGIIYLGMSLGIETVYPTTPTCTNKPPPYTHGQFECLKGSLSFN